MINVIQVTPEYIIEWDDINMFGTGKNLTEAIIDLRDVVIEYYQELNNNLLGPIPFKDLEYLNSVFEEMGND